MIFLPFGDRVNNGVDKGVIDEVFNGNGFGIVKTKVTQAPYKIQTITRIGLDEWLHPKDIIQVGNLGIKYQVIGVSNKRDNNGGYLYRIKRIDGANITNTDLQNIVVGQTARIVNRRSNRQRAEQLQKFLDQNPE
jgi:hypothetical protein